MSDLVHFAGNDYLGLATHPAVVTAMQEAAGRYGISSTASRWSVGWTDVHEQLERNLATFLLTQDACIFGSAYLGGAIYFGRMAARGYRIVLCDETVHANQYMGMRAAGLEVRTFRHLDVADLKRQAASCQGQRAILATDGVYGISGEVAPLAEMAEVARQIGAELFVDDAHGVGVIGATGRGSVELCNVDPGGATVLGSMSKAMGTYGGFLAGRREFVEEFRHSPEASGSTAMPPALAAASLAALDLICRQPSLRDRLHANAAAMRRILADNNIPVVCDKHPIIAMLLADEVEAARLAEHFLSQGLRIPYFQYASEPRHNLLRAVGRAVYTSEHLARFEQAVRSRPKG